jgi:transcription termination/antitermination factor NusG
VSQRWYIVHAYSNFEHKVKSSLEERIKLMGLEEKFGDILVPTEEVVEMKEGQKRRSERKFFPGYVLVQMEMDDETWHLVKEVPKVLGFIGGSSDKPAPITEKEANQILNRVQEGVGTSNRWSVQRLQWRCGAGELREEQITGRSSDSRSVNTGRAGLRASREGLGRAT